MLISHRAASELTLFDLDTSSVAARIPFAAAAELEAGPSGRYGYAHDPAEGVLHVVDPGQWLLSHIDHFHVVRGEHRLMDEQVRMPGLSSLLANDGWITAYGSGAVAAFQERSITARSFAPTLMSVASASTGVALVARAQLVASDGDALTQRSALDSRLETARFPGCTHARDAAVHNEHLYIACAEGLLQLSWADERFVPTFRTNEPIRAVRTGTNDTVLQTGTRTLVLLRELRRIELPSEIAAFALRNTRAIVLTVDGHAHELDVQTGAIARSTPLPVTAQTRLVLSHAYAYVTDPSSPQVHVLRLRTMQLEAALSLHAPAHDLTLVGVPGTYTDDRE